MKEYSIVRKTGWENVPALEISESPLPLKADIRAKAQICYDDEKLYVRLIAHEENIRATYTDSVTSQPCEDSCMEFFFSPDNSQKKYFNIEMNPNCAMYLGIGCRPDGLQLFRLDKTDTPFDFKPEAVRTEDGWQLTYEIPYTFIRYFFPAFDPKPGTYIMANCYKCGDKCKPMHLLSWSPVDLGIGDCAFHNPECFGKMIFA